MKWKIYKQLEDGTYTQFTLSWLNDSQAVKMAIELDRDRIVSDWFIPSQL